MHDHGLKADVRAAVVMPDHVHLIFTPLINERAREVYSLAEIMDAIKGASAHLINRLLVRSGRVWQEESFDRVRGLVGSREDYPWTWVVPVMMASVG